MRLIDADALIENTFKNDISYNAFKNLVKRQVTIDAVPAKTGLWLVNKDRWGRYYGACSCCGFKQYAGITNYCPDCGAKLKEKVNDETD